MGYGDETRKPRSRFHGRGFRLLRFFLLGCSWRPPASVDQGEDERGHRRDTACDRREERCELQHGILRMPGSASGESTIVNLVRSLFAGTRRSPVAPSLAPDLRPLRGGEVLGTGPCRWLWLLALVVTDRSSPACHRTGGHVRPASIVLRRHGVAISVPDFRLRGPGCEAVHTGVSWTSESHLWPFVPTNGRSQMWSRI